MFITSIIRSSVQEGQNKKSKFLRFVHRICANALHKNINTFYQLSLFALRPRMLINRPLSSEHCPDKVSLDSSRKMKPVLGGRQRVLFTASRKRRLHKHRNEETLSFAWSVRSQCSHGHFFFFFTGIQICDPL